MNTHELLKGLKVLELANILAGPAVGMFLAELGAEVLKVENKHTHGDITRQWKVPEEDANSPYSAYYCHTNWGKRAELRDLKDPADHDQILQWASEADIILSNFKLASARKLGIDYDTLKGINPRVIYAQLTAFGENDPRLGFDVVLQAETGWMYMTGEAGGPPVKLPVALIDLLAAHQLKEGILCALLQPPQSGQGAYVHTSLAQSSIATLANQAGNWLMAGHVPQRKGTQHPNIAPYGDVFLTQDHQQIVLAVGTHPQFQALMQVLGLPVPPEFSSNTQRVIHRQQLREVLLPAIATWKAEDLLLKLHQAQVPVGKIRDMPSVFEMEIAREMVLTQTLPDGSTAKCVKTVAFDIR